MKKQRDIEKMIGRTINEFSPFLKGYRVYLFGSRVSFTSTTHSDFDVGILGEKPLSSKVFFAIEDALEQLPTLHKIDWVNLNHVSEQFLENVLKHARVIYE